MSSYELERRPPEAPAKGIQHLELRTRLSRMRALLWTAAGRPRGFFTQYAYAEHVQPVAEPYPEVEGLFEASPFRAFLREIQSLEAELKSFGACASDPVLGRGMFPALDGMAAYAAIRKFRPQTILEIGSGDSTFLLARGVKDNGSGRIICIDPQPRREILELDIDFRPRLLANEDANIAGELEANDVLFIDSSHIMLPGMDVDIQFNRMFPRLKSGVLVHIHDIFLPFDYPTHWKIRHYSEQNALMGWILSGYFEIVWPGYYVFSRHHAEAKELLAGIGPLEAAGSLWLRKT